MAYLGRSLTAGNYLKLDDIESQFNGSLVSFDLTAGGSPHYPGSSYSLHVSLGGVVQEPEAAYIINQDQIQFASAPTSGQDCFIVSLGLPLGVGVPADGTVGLQHLQESAKLGITTGGTAFSGYGVTQLDFKGPGVSTAYFNAATGVGTVYFQGGGGGVGAAGTWSATNVGVNTTKMVGIGTSAVGAATSEGIVQAVGNVTILDGALITDQNIDTNITVPTGKNGLLIGPVTVGVGKTIDVHTNSVLVVV